MPRNKSPLREHAFRIGSIAAVFVLVILVELLAPVVTGHGAPTSLALLTIVATLIVAVPAVVLGLFIGRRIVGDRIEVAIRQDGGKWRHGRVAVSPGHLTFQPYRWQVRIPAGPPVDMHVQRLGDDTGRRPSLKQIWSVNPQLHIVDVVTENGIWELAALPSRITELRERLEGQHIPAEQ